MVGGVDDIHPSNYIRPYVPGAFVRFFHLTNVKNALTCSQLLHSFLLVLQEIFLDGVVYLPSAAWNSRDTAEHSFFSYLSRSFP